MYSRYKNINKYENKRKKFLDRVINTNWSTLPYATSFIRHAAYLGTA